MRLPFLTICAAGLAAVRAVSFTNTNYGNVKAGTPFTLTWSGDSTPCTLKFLTGPSTNLKEVQTLSTSATGSSYTFTIPSTIVSGTYAFSITQSGSTNYSPQFPITGAAPSSSSIPTLTKPTTSKPHVTAAPTGVKAGHDCPYGVYNATGGAYCLPGKGAGTASGSWIISTDLSVQTLVSVYEKYKCGSDEGCQEFLGMGVGRPEIGMAVAVAGAAAWGVWMMVVA